MARFPLAALTGSLLVVREMRFFVHKHYRRLYHFHNITTEHIRLASEEHLFGMQLHFSQLNCHICLQAQAAMSMAFITAKNARINMVRTFNDRGLPVFRSTVLHRCRSGRGLSAGGRNNRRIELFKTMQEVKQYCCALMLQRPPQPAQSRVFVFLECRLPPQLKQPQTLLFASTGSDVIKT